MDISITCSNIDNVHANPNGFELTVTVDLLGVDKDELLSKFSVEDLRDHLETR